jgi:hypothetical protein
LRVKSSTAFPRSLPRCACAAPPRYAARMRAAFESTAPFFRPRPPHEAAITRPEAKGQSHERAF